MPPAIHSAKCMYVDTDVGFYNLYAYKFLRQYSLENAKYFQYNFACLELRNAIHKCHCRSKCESEREREMDSKSTLF